MIKNKIKNLTFLQYQILKIIIINAYNVVFIIWDNNYTDRANIVFSSISTILIFAYGILSFFGNGIYQRSNYGKIKELPWILMEIASVVDYHFI